MKLDYSQLPVFERVCNKKQKLVSRYGTLGTVAESIANGSFRAMVGSAKHNFYRYYGDSMEQAGRMTMLPEVAFGVQRRKNYSGLVALLLYPCNETHLEDLRREVNGQPTTLLSYLDLNGSALVVVVPCTLPDGSLPSGKADEANETVALFHETAFVQVAKSYERMVDCRVDCVEETNPAAMFFMNNDDKMFFNPDAQVLAFEQPTGHVTDGSLLKHVERTDGISPLLPDMDKQFGVMTCYWSCLLRAAENISKKKIKSLDRQLAEVARVCHANGVDMEYALGSLQRDERFNRRDGLARTCFQNEYGREASVRNARLTGFRQIANDVEDYVKRRYHIRRNELTGVLEIADLTYIVTHWRTLEDQDVNDMVVSLHQMDSNAVKKDVLAFLGSNAIKNYNPVRDYFNGLPRWDGRDRVNDFLGRVPAANSFWLQDGHTWLLGMVNQWLNPNSRYPLSMMPILIGSQGTRKTIFCRMILPPGLKDLVREQLEFKNEGMLEKSLTRYCLIIMDELDSLTKRQNASMKRILTELDPSTRRLFSENEAHRHRMAAFIATTNEADLLTDATGSRRFLCVKLNGRIDVGGRVDYGQLYAQLLAELEAGERKCYFDEEDEKRIQLQNQDFTFVGSLEELFSMTFRLPQEADKAEWLSSVEIIQAINSKFKDVRVPINDRRQKELGWLMKKLGYERQHLNTGKRYKVCREK